jgi:hypothetical protein
MSSFYLQEARVSTSSNFIWFLSVAIPYLQGEKLHTGNLSKSSFIPDHYVDSAALENLTLPFIFL